MSKYIICFRGGAEKMIDIIITKIRAKQNKTCGTHQHKQLCLYTCINFMDNLLIAGGMGNRVGGG